MPQDGRQSGREGLLFTLSLLHRGHRVRAGCTRPQVVPDCRMDPSEQAADLIFQHTAAPTSGPGEGDLPCLLECLLKGFKARSIPCQKKKRSTFTSDDAIFFNFCSHQNIVSSCFNIHSLRTYVERNVSVVVE